MALNNPVILCLISALMYEVGKITQSINII